MSNPLLPLILTATIAGGSVSKEVTVCDEDTCRTYQQAAYNFRLSTDLAKSDLRLCEVREKECVDGCDTKKPIISDWAIGIGVIGLFIISGAVVFAEVHD